MTKGDRFIKFWGTILTVRHFMEVGKIPQTEQKFRPIRDIYIRVCEAAKLHGFTEGWDFIEYWELDK